MGSPITRMAMIVEYVGGAGVVVAVLAQAEKYIIEFLPQSIADTVQVKLPKLYGAVIISNLCLSTVTMMMLGMRVSKARKECKEAAEKEGADSKQFEYPNMYVSGGSERAMYFNCTQRGHQQALETYTSFVGLSLVGGIRHPILTSAAGILWSIARLKWAEGYNSKVEDENGVMVYDPMNRYKSSAFGFHIWTSFLIVLNTSASTAAGVSGIF